MARILLIEDDPLVLSMLCRMLERLGHEVEAAMDGNDGLTLFLKHSADLVITDIMMPKMNGVELIRRLRSHDPDVRVLAISGGGHQLDLSDGLELAARSGALATMKKPFTKQALEAVIEELLGPLPG